MTLEQENALLDELVDLKYRLSMLKNKDWWSERDYDRHDELVKQIRDIEAQLETID